MRRIESNIDTSSDEFRLNWKHNRTLAETLKERHRAVRRERPARDAADAADNAGARHLAAIFGVGG